MLTMSQVSCQAQGILWQVKPEMIPAFVELMVHLQEVERNQP